MGLAFSWNTSENPRPHCFARWLQDKATESEEDFFRALAAYLTLERAQRVYKFDAAQYSLTEAQVRAEVGEGEGREERGVWGTMLPHKSEGAVQPQVCASEEGRVSRGARQPHRGEENRQVSALRAALLCRLLRLLPCSRATTPMMMACWTSRSSGGFGEPWAGLGAY